MAEQIVELYTGSATGTQIDAAAAKVAAMEETLSGTAGTIPSSAAVKNYVDSKSVDTESTLSGDAVYDISEANNGTTYANLAAALNNGNNIPASIRKGGMSIKFIQSSDNKYVQYRLMTQSFSIIESDWQGVDEQPIEGSKNMVTSGGTANSINQLASFFEKDIIEGINIESRINHLTGGAGNTPIYYQDFNTKDVKILAIATYQTDIDVYIVTASSFGSIPTKTEKIASVKADNVKKVKYLVLNKTLASNEYLGISGGFMYGYTKGYKMCRASDGQISIDYSLGFSIAGIYCISKESFEGLQEDVQNLQENVQNLQENVGYSKYIKLYENNLTQNNGLTVNGTWSFDINGATPSATGSGTWFMLNKNYWSDKRFMQVEASMKSNTNLIITCTSSSVNDGEGASCFAVDFASGLLKIFSVGAGDDQATSTGYTSTVLESEDISDIVAEHTYRIRLYKDSTLHTLEITDMLTGITKSVSHNGWAAGRQNQRYGFYVDSGSLPTLKNISIYTLNRPNVVFTGDSITEGVMVTNRTKRYAELYRTNHPHLKVVISAMGGRQLSELISMFDNEWAICKPKILSCLIGANGGVSQNGFESLKAKCDSIGCKLIVHYCTCQQSNDSHIEKNELIGSLSYSGARFDIATAKDNYPFIDSQHLAPRYNPSLYHDLGLHPNIDGDEAMYSRMMLDCIELDIE